MPRGRKPKPTEALKLQGTFRQDRRSKQEPEPEIRLPSCPRWLDKDARELWKSLGKKLEANRMITDVDSLAFSLLCQMFADYRQAKREADKGGVVVTTDKGNWVQSPAVGVRNKTWQLLLKVATEFGLTPSSRTRVHAGDGKSDNPFAEFLRGGVG